MPDAPKGGQPTALTPKRAALALKRCGEGVPVDAIAGELGVARSTLYHWLELGEAAAPLPEHAHFVAFALAWRAAEAKDIRGSLARVRRTAKGHRGEQFHLERRYPKIFGTRAAIELTGKDGKAIEHKHEVTVDVDALYLALQQRRARRGGGPGSGGPGGATAP